MLSKSLMETCGKASLRAGRYRSKILLLDLVAWKGMQDLRLLFLHAISAEVKLT